MDLIDRQAAIGRIEKKLEEVYGYTKTEYSEGYVNACHAAEKMLNSLPSAQPERKKGKWIFVESVYKHDGWDSDIYRCNQCHRRTELRVVLKSGEDITDYKRYCECCGADMRGEENETD